MGDAATVFTGIAGAFAAAAVSVPLSVWCATLTAGPSPTIAGRPVGMAHGRWVTVVLAAVLGGVAPLLVPFPAWWLLGAGGAVLAVVDWRTHRLPARFVQPLAAAVALVLLVDAAATGQWSELGRAALAAAVVGSLWFVVAFVSPGAVGLGDIRVAALAAGLLGWSGWTVVFAGQLAASLLGVLTAAAMTATRRSVRSGVPMGSALILGAFLAALTA